MWCYVVFNNDHALFVAKDESLAQVKVNELKQKQRDPESYYYHYRKVEFIDDGR